MKKKIIAVIPARFESTRFPGKALADVAGKPMIQRVYEQVKKTKVFDYVIIGTDNKRIATTVQKFIKKNDEIILTKENYDSGTDRIADIAEIYQLDKEDIVVNVQGDNPLVNPESLKDLVEAMLANCSHMATLAYPITKRHEILDPNTVKVVIDNKNYALYFSRSCIPGGKLTTSDKRNIKPIPRLKHIGIYAYTVNFLKTISELPVSNLEKIEKLEQLRVLENGYNIYVVISKFDCPDVNAPYDIRRVEEIIKCQKVLKRKNIVK